MSVLPTDGNPAGAGESGQPTPPASPAQGQLSQADLEALERRLEKKISGVQKGTDTQIGQVRDNVKRILELKEEGLSEAQIQRELRLDALLEGRDASPAQPVGNRESAPSLEVKPEDIDKALELPANDPRVTELHVKHGNDPVAYLREATKFKLSLPQNQPSPAEQPLPGGSSVTKKEPSVEELTEKYYNDMKAAQGKPELARQIRAEAIKKGVPVDSVIF